MNNSLNVLYQSSNLYSQVTGVSLTSLLENNKNIEFIHIFLISDGISSDNLDKFSEICKLYNREISIIDTEPFKKKLVNLDLPKWKGGYTPYYKLLAFGEFNFKTDKLLVLDSDTIIDKSIIEIIDIDISDCLGVAAYDCIVNDYKKSIGLSSKYYYNTGVFYLNLNKWKVDRNTNRIIQHLSKIRSSYVVADQDILNVLFGDEIKELDLCYNFNPAFYLYGINETFFIYNIDQNFYYSIKKIENTMENIKIYHCMGAMTGRPWEANNSHPQNALYDFYKLMSPWAEATKMLVKKSNIYMFQLILYKNLPRFLYIYFHKYFINLNFNIQNRNLVKKSKEKKY